MADLTVHVGPPSLGTGGSNPISIPPVNPLDYEFIITTKEHTEWTIGLIPGFFWGKRFVTNKMYASMGGGAVVNFQGIGPGVYMAVGTDVCGFLCFNIEVKQAIGVTLGSYKLINPSAVRVGLTFAF